MMSVQRAFAYAAVAMATAAVIGGLYLAGSPVKERAKQLDMRRENDLQQISSAVDAYHAQEGSLPASLQLLLGPDKNYLYASVTDPATKVAYEYTTTGETTYDLCATFDAVSSPVDQFGNVKPVMTDSGMRPWGSRTWDHQEGRTCFSLDALDSMTYGISCSLTAPCQAGQNCVTLPGRSGAVCVPQGKECLAAKCGGECVIAESYPAQIRCGGDSAAAPAPSPKKPAGSSTCDLLQDPESGKVDCFGCAGGTCTSAPSGWVMYSQADGSMGIPYACYETESGCALAQ